MRCFLALACLLVVATAQDGNKNEWFDRLKDFFNNEAKYDFTIDYVHNYRIEDHDIRNGPHILLAISDERPDRACHIIEVGDEWEDYLKDQDLVEQLSEEIYKLITTHTAQESNMSLNELKRKYGDNDAIEECRRHKVYIMKYTPSFHPMPTKSA